MPVWLQPFIEEFHGNHDVSKLKGRKQWTVWTLTLFALFTVGMILEAVTALYRFDNFSAVLPAISWGTTILLLIIDRPHSAPIGILAIMTSIAVVQLILRLNNATNLHISDLSGFLAMFTSLASITLILCMPLRDSVLPTDHISAPFAKPTSQLRSPEDRLTPWQFMSVAWMSPLIALGSARQLEDGDVWSLGYEFQHKELHEKFRELRGSVIKRLLKANGLDLVILTSLGILESSARFATPALLQQVLRSMEDQNAPQRATIVYALLSLTVRMIGCQSSVFSLWYGRRCYERSRGEMITMLHEKVLSRKIIGVSSQTEQSDLSERQPASTGKILNLMRNDVYEVAQRFYEFETLFTTPLALVFSIVLVWKLIGWPCLLGVVTVIIAQCINALITRVLLQWEKIRRSATDTKLQKTSQFVEAIRHLRWYGWQEFWLDLILQARRKELNVKIRTSLWTLMIMFVNTFASSMFPVAAFYAYTALAGLPLRIDIAFPALQLFKMLESSLRSIPGLITVLLNARIAVGRIEDFMAEPDKEQASVLPAVSNDGSLLRLCNASFAWPGRSDFVLHDIDLIFPVGLSLIVGEVASGKTALLQAILGELDTLNGYVSRPCGVFGYCAQSPWLQSMSIRDNILFASPCDEDRYRCVLEACALTVDMASFKNKDLSLIGENGVGLSGGQRARVALARAVYSRASILLLDDPLSALDHQTAEFIVKRCFRGPLMDGRTVILVTHRVELCNDIAQQVIQVIDGRAHKLEQGESLSTLSQPETSEPHNEEEEKRIEAQDMAVPDKFLEDEKRVHGGVKAKVYWEYIRAGRLSYWAILVMILAVFRLADVAEDWFLKEWGEGYDRPREGITSIPFGNLPSPERNITPWLLGLFVIATFRSLILLLAQGCMVVIIYTAGREMFEAIMHRVSHATFRFYDVTPVGRLMNRLTSDIGTIDGNISYQFQDITFLAITWISSVVVIASVTPIFLIFSVGLSAAFVFIFLRFLPTSQSLRRLEMVSLSPLMSNFGALLHGLTTVRAFCVQKRFQDRVIEVTDAFQKMDHFYWSLQAWLMYRFDALSAFSTFILTMLALFTGVSPGLTAFVLIAAAQFVSSTHSLCRRYGRLQMDFVSVERIVELLHLELEPAGTISPPAMWPSYGGDIIFEGVTIRYAPHLDPSLSDISFHIPGGSTTALLGRTGSGKSTLALSLLATTLPTNGSIFIDGIDISKVDTQALRHRVTFLAQDPVLFPGSMRQNLDPLNEHTDDECAQALERICARHGWNLETQIDTGGSNLSQGQRQLVGLTRAVLRRSAVIILDEATASIDMETAMTIQRILREEMRESTVITIAHRLEAVKDADYFIRLDHGRLIEQGPVTSHTMIDDGRDPSSSSSG
ncbi:MAG: hypothetical protein Q9163_000292 [Psora crenata]